jgi:hypothetical protein
MMSVRFDVIIKSKQPMDLNLGYISEQDIVGAEIEGKVTLRDVQQAAADGLKLARDKHCHSYLIDISRATIKYSAADVIAFIEGLTKMGFSKQDRVAFVISRNEKRQRFWETAALNRGWGRIGYFTTSSEAKQWLTSR